MAAKRERRTAMWPYLVLPLAVVVVFYTLYRVHQRPAAAAPAPADSAAATHSAGG